jgi:hypothetical protein
MHSTYGVTWLCMDDPYWLVGLAPALVTQLQVVAADTACSPGCSVACLHVTTSEPAHCPVDLVRPCTPYATAM